VGEQAACKMSLPVADLHCDLLSYLNSVKDDPWDKTQIGCAIPFLQEGGVKLQVMAIYSDYEKGTVQRALGQAQKFNELLSKYPEVFSKLQPDLKIDSDKIQILASVENATGFAEKDDHLDTCFQNLETFIEATEQILYIGITHHYENRFGGGNYSRGGLKEDGKVLLDYLSGKKIAIDFAHASDALARDVINYIDKKGLNLSIMASHSNFRVLTDHPRNLPGDIAREIIKRKGLIGINLLRDYVDQIHPERLLDHIQYGWDLDGKDVLTFGADFFYIHDMPDKSRLPFFHPEHEDASKYPLILNQLSKNGINQNTLKAFAHQNVLNFIQSNS